MNTYHVYAVVSQKTQDAYVGCTTQFRVRCAQHTNRLNQGSHPNQPLQDAWKREGGVTAFDFVVLSLLEGVSRDRAGEVEAAWIRKIGTYNVVNGDEQHHDLLWPDQRRQAMSEHAKRRWADPEQRAALIKGPLKGNGFQKGMAPVKTPEQDAKHSTHMKAVWADPEKRTKLEARRAVRWSDPEAKARQAEKMRAYHAARRAAKTVTD